jgi:hypothetical protein
MCEARRRAQPRTALAATIIGLRVPELPADQVLPAQGRLDAIAEQYVEQTLRHLARHALLEPDVA